MLNVSQNKGPSYTFSKAVSTVLPKALSKTKERMVIKSLQVFNILDYKPGGLI